jgi:hypothetical protein
MMNESYFQAVIEDRKREVVKLSEGNQNYRLVKDSTAWRQEFAKDDKHVFGRWLLNASRWIKSLLSYNNKSSLKARG